MRSVIWLALFLAAAAAVVKAPSLAGAVAAAAVICVIWPFRPRWMP